MLSLSKIPWHMFSSLILDLLQIPASVRVKRESALPKSKPKPSTTVVANQPMFTAAVLKQESTSSSHQPKPQSIDDSYMAFLEDMKALGALDGGN